MGCDIEKEYRAITLLAEERYKLKERLDQIDEEISMISFYWYVGRDGLVEVGLGVV